MTIRRRDESTESRLRAAISASPDDDAPRLVYADWLLERGDPRGEFIQIQCMLGRPISALGRPISARGKLHPNHPMARSTQPERDPESRRSLELREHALLREHQKTWIAPIRGYINSWFWERGFVSRVDVNVKKFITHIADITDFSPLCAVYLMGCTPALVRQFSETPLVGSLRSLTLDAQRIGVREAELFCSPHLAKLQDLTLRHNPFGDEAMKVLASSTTLGELRTLDLSFSEQNLTSRGIESLSCAAFFPGLTQLVLDCSLANGTAIGPILKRGSSLKSLSLGAQKITKQEAKIRAARGLAEPTE
jgi:uncharacterized protein (TIGR02996 family)